MHQDEPCLSTKPFDIPKRILWEAWKCVAANKGAPGVDKESITAFGERLGPNLYKLWNRMSSGSYMPSPVRQVLIPKGAGEFRPLGIPTVGDRVAQMTVKLIVEARLEQLFHPSSFGYRPQRSAHHAVEQARRHCWRYDWVLDMDMKAFFDTLDHDLMMRAVEKHIPESWIRLYIRRWLACPVIVADGQCQPRDRGTPQGGVISPILANLYLHYAFDSWMNKYFPQVPFERYADDIVCHCRTESEGKALLEALQVRLTACRLQLHPEKTRLVYCKDGRRTGHAEHTRFDFLGFSFHARTVQDRQGKLFSGFNPGVGRKALKRMGEVLRGMKIARATGMDLRQLAKRINSRVRGWITYYGKFYPEILSRALVRIDLHLGRWARNKYKRLRGHKRRSWNWLKQIRGQCPKLFAHWVFIYTKVVG
ncbi:MAG: group II intron reverse transcriptase/maturase [Puia sp.]|nr:group II intron reverse transcriptase/maturase [Puia sp.]